MKNGLTIESLNVNSIGKFDKRNQVFHFLRKRATDIFVLLDTRIDPKLESKIKTEWSGPAYFSSFSSNQRGVCILLKKNIPVEVLDVKPDKSGNLLHLLIKNDLKIIQLSCLYAPNIDSPLFFDEKVFNNVNDWEPEHQIFVGDWNLVLDQEMDTKNYIRENNIKAREMVIEKIDQLELLDIYREFNPSVKRYSWFKKDKTCLPKCARLDFFLVSNSISPFVTECNINPAILTDHSIISLNINFSNFKHGPGFWKFNNSLLKDPFYVKEIKSLFRKVTAQYCKQTFDDKISDFDLQQLELNINDQLFFDTILMEVRGFTIQYTSRKKKEMNFKYNQLSNNLQDLEKKFCETPECNLLKEKISNCRMELEQLNEYKAEGAAIRSRAFYSLQGERATKHFCTLEKNNASSKFISKLNVDGKMINNQEEIESKIYEFYKDLYKEQKTHKHVSINSFLQDDSNTLQKLTPAQISFMDKSISLDEIGNYLKKLKNNKSPGTTGFSGNFYKFFYRSLMNI